MSVLAGNRIGPFMVQERLGAGGMGEVYRARDAKLERDIALKVLSGGSGDEEHLRRFEQEARAASALNHPNIVTIYEIGADHGVAYIAMELIEGENLRHALSRGDMTLKKALRIASRIADGLAAAHEKGIVHRDLKPENVMISSEGFVKILDFGLAKLSRPVSATDVTMEATAPGVVFGTIAYMSPEQASGKRTDFRSDQFSFGAMLYELITGKPVFRRESAAETLAAILREEPPPLRFLDPSIPPELERIVSRCLAKEMEERYGSTRDLARDLREVRDALTRPGHSSDRIRSGRIDAPTPRRALVRAALLGAALLALLTWMAIRGREPAGPAPATQPRMRTLAVAQFRERNGTPDSKIFVDGLAASISSRLAAAPGLRVVSPAEDVPFAGSTADDLARAHGADYVLRGDVEQVRDRLRIGVKVVDIATGAEVAARTFTGAARDLFTLQDDVTAAVLGAVKADAPPRRAEPALDGEDQRRLVEALGLLQRGGDVHAIEGAIERLEDLLTNARDSALINSLLGRAYLFAYRESRKTALLEQATLYSERALQLDRHLPETHLAAGELYLTVGKNSAAEAAFRRVLELRPENAAALLGLADTYDALGRAGDAEQTYERVLSLVPGWPVAYTRFGRFCFSRGRYEKAVSLFDTLSRLSPESPRPFTNLGAAYHALGRYDEAVRAYERAIAIGPTASSWSNLGTCQYFLGRFDDAARSFDQAVRLSPDNYLLWANAADAFRWSSTDRFRAREAYERSIALGRKDLGINSSNALMRAVMASSLAKLGRGDEAKKEIDAALRVNPTDADVLYHAAITAVIRGDSDGAVLWLARAIDAGYVTSNAASDPELAALRGRKDFQDLLRSPGARGKEKEKK